MDQQPSSDDFTSYELSDGTSMSLWASGDCVAGEWTYFWAEFERGELPQVWYRTFPLGTTPAEWLPMKAGADVFRETGFEDEEDDDQGAQLGAAVKLAAGRHVLQARIVIEGTATEWPGVTFTVNAAS